MAGAADAAGGNPSSVHTPGRKARAIMSEARSRIAQCLGAAPAQIVFTASGSEANNLAIKGAALRAFPKAFHLIISAFEHDSVLYAARYLAERFDHVRLSEVRPNAEGVIEPGEIDRACAEGASLICVMAVNNEIGTVQPVEEIAAIARARGARFHLDAVQAAGRLEINTEALGCDSLSISAHKIYGPRGIGLLYLREGSAIDALIHGGHQEKGRRAGTEDLPAIAGFAEAVMLSAERLDDDRRHLAEIEKAFVDRLAARDLPFKINGSTKEKAPGVMNLSLRGAQSHDLVAGMDLSGFAISAGAACSSGVIEPSHVLKAMDIEPWRIQSGVRISMGRSTSAEDMVQAADALADLWGRLQKEETSLLENTP